ncbi:hypothetical protein TPAU25S_04250 [Tsukamurella paurometabola]|uniref:DUF402 domain-containing protein n=1 Tax=Tsukamurella paurometabola (strain ATCC 8368 / DSM 20162 / CCUG 35730 / CIP 100753 / JCM 10117 / KCTC 9821 / NBRC 16120 / NCIMB 702349 / NCTC 13040) TaxID=521096 RepID=D5UR46_TSUPD|nr:protein of unknown function DUF402 [Tsukamurella paurometabola DSM 20162]SUP33838.1 Protein of uncharacterised function (DUF402) [Tsukamurella paurometabola]
MQAEETFELTVDGAAAIGAVEGGWLDLTVLDAAEDAVPALLGAARERASGVDGILVRTHDDALGALLRRHGFRPSGAVVGRPRGRTEVTLVLRFADDPAVDDGAVHPPKHEVFDPPAMTNTDPKGFLREVEEFRETPFGLYVVRRADHPRFDAIESWLLPAFDLRATIFHFTPGHERDQRVYLDVARVWRDGYLWHTEDWYLDLVEHPGRPIELIDVDELLAASAADLLSAADAERALHAAVRAVAGTAAHGHSVDAWLAAEGAPVTWR